MSLTRLILRRSEALPYGDVVCRKRTALTSMAMLPLTLVPQRCRAPPGIETEALLSFHMLMTSTLARHMAGSATKHWLAVQHVLRYLQSTIDVVLTFNVSGNESVVDVYSDADFANGVSLKSVSGMVLRMYGNCVFWRSKRQDIIAGDTTEAELIAMSRAANELMWIKQLCTELNITAKKPTLWGDIKKIKGIFSCRKSYL